MLTPDREFNHLFYSQITMGEPVLQFSLYNGETGTSCFFKLMNQIATDFPITYKLTEKPLFQIALIKIKEKNVPGYTTCWGYIAKIQPGLQMLINVHCSKHLQCVHKCMVCFLEGKEE